MRDAFIAELTKRSRKDKKIFLLTGDLGFSVFEEFIKKFPKRFVNVGIAEANMIGVAAGLALSGKIAFTYSIIPFSVVRCLEQIKIDVCYQKTNVKIVGVGAGYAYGSLGVTHHAIEDMAVLRAYPNMRIFSPCDSFETESCLDVMIKNKGPFYLRLGKNREPKVHSGVKKTEIGGSHIIREGSDITVLATGGICFNALEAVKILAKKGIKCRLVSMYSVKPIDKKIILESARKTKKIITIEEHTVIGGLGSAVSEVIAASQERNARLKMIGVEDIFSHHLGSQDYLRQMHGFSKETIAKNIESFLRGKK